jgi:hypothetical protein
MPWSGPEVAGERTSAELRARAKTVRGYAHDIIDKEAAERLHGFATELDAKAAALDQPITPDVADP